jgi:hypothetical protein
MRKIVSRYGLTFILGVALLVVIVSKQNTTKKVDLTSFEANQKIYEIYYPSNLVRRAKIYNIQSPAMDRVTKLSQLVADAVDKKDINQVSVISLGYKDDISALQIQIRDKELEKRLAEYKKKSGVTQEQIKTVEQCLKKARKNDSEMSDASECI